MQNLSDYEVLELLDTYIHSTSDYFMQFLSVYFAYLLAVWLVGRKLSPNMTAAMLFLYTTFTILPASGSFVSFGVAHEIANEIVSRGTDLAAVAHSSVVIYSGSGGKLIHYLATGLQIVAYLAGLVFLWEVRNRGLFLSNGGTPPNKAMESDT